MSACSSLLSGLCYDKRMSSITFDTHKFVKDLQAAGVPPAQAEAFVLAQQEILARTGFDLGDQE